MVFGLPCDTTGEDCTTFLSYNIGNFINCHLFKSIINRLVFLLNTDLKSQEEQDERSPLLGPYLRVNNNVAASSIGNFYSPIESAHNSDDEDDQFEEYKTAGIENIKKSLELLESTDWKIENINKKTGDQIQAVHRKGIGKIYRMTVSRVKYIYVKFVKILNFRTGTSSISCQRVNAKTIFWHRNFAQLESHCS